MSGLAIPPLVYEWGNDFGRTLLTTPIAARHRAEACNLWRTARVQVVAIGVLSTLAYLLVLGALRIAPLTFVAPVREISIVFGTALGTQTLAEGHTALRMASAVAILGGVVALALA